MNGARLGIAAQSVGVSEAAYREALAYAKERMQFGKAIVRFPAVYEMLSLMKAKLDASRTLLYETARFVDMYKTYMHISEERKLEKEERDEMKNTSVWLIFIRRWQKECQVSIVTSWLTMRFRFMVVPVL